MTLYCGRSALTDRYITYRETCLHGCLDERTHSDTMKCSEDHGIYSQCYVSCEEETYFGTIEVSTAYKLTCKICTCHCFPCSMGLQI